ncbi:MAG TPA: 30S ribosomal protein S16 [Candidatus Paceibacterota bacterium]
MLTIRLQRTGRKHEPTYRVVLTDSKNGPKSGKYLKNLGWYDTRIKNSTEQLDVEQIKHWISKGAQTSITVHNFLVSKKVIDGKKLNALPKKTPIKKDAPAPEGAAAAAPAAAAPAQA